MATVHGLLLAYSLLSEPGMPAMQPEPQLDYVLVFDGGSINNPGRGYGSYHLSGPGIAARIQRLEFGDRVTNNEAEYRALIAGLEDLETSVQALGREPGKSRVRILGDSQLVLNQLLGGWRVRSATLRPLYERARALLDRFGEVTLTWHPRAKSVALLGH